MNTGIATVTIQGLGNYTGTKVVSFTILRADAAAFTVKKLAPKVYTGKNVTQPNLKVYSSSDLLQVNKDYKVSYSNNKYCGKAKVILTGVSNYTGQKILYFNITPKKVTGLSLKAGAAKQLTVKWKTSKGKSTGYQITYATNSKFKKSKRHTTVNNSESEARDIRPIILLRLI